MTPSYEPAVGRAPVSLTVTVFCAPAFSEREAGETVTLALAAFVGCSSELKLAAAPGTLVMVRERLMGKAPVAMGPKAMVAGSRVAATFMASTALSRPAPTALTPARVMPCGARNKVRWPLISARSNQSRQDQPAGRRHYIAGIRLALSDHHPLPALRDPANQADVRAHQHAETDRVSMQQPAGALSIRAASAGPARPTR